ncbi:unnamed protein product [Gongylonema pulchrum]|uniref:Uncharacterized protein n=1 Tax=Gongylonema pulchrum TaxID=637853 RepID=A0A183EYI0_9BILA|nr:unnamed protein product [Gongylonema pulchrum]
MANLQEFHHLVSRMLCPENETRMEAEKHYDQIDLSTKAQLLFQLFLDQTAEAEVSGIKVCSIRGYL